MATRPVFMTSVNPPYRKAWQAEFVYNGGFAVSQKQKNITAIHNAFQAHFPGKKVLEISSKSMQEGGEALSAFHLLKYVPSLGKSVPVENVFQAGKVFRNGGPYTDLLGVSPREAKRDERLRTSGPLIAFRFEGQDFPLHPQTAFYDYLYIQALLENEELAKIVLEYDAFTDVEFNPERSLNCQAKAAALFVSLNNLDLIGKITDFDSFLTVLQTKPEPVRQSPPQPKEVQPVAEPSQLLKINDSITHKLWGKGIVTDISGTSAVIEFPTVGTKKLGIAWVMDNCEIG